MKMFKKVAAAMLSLAFALSVVVSSISVSAAGVSAQLLNKNQRKFYDALVQRYVTEFSYGSTGSFNFWFRGEGGLEFDTTEGEVTTEELFVAAAMFVADYSTFLPWLDMEGQITEEYPMPFLAAVNDTTIGEGESAVTLNLAVAMFAVKEDYVGNVAELFGFPNITIKAPAVSDGGESPNKALGASVTVESTALDGENNPRADLAGELAVDGDINTRWQAQTTPSETTPTWIALDMGTAKSFDRARLYWETARPTYDGYSIQISENGTDWTDVEIASRERSGDESPYFDNVMFKNKVTSRYVRIYITVSEKLASSAWEIELYDGEPDAPPATLTGIEITKAPNKTNYIKGTFEIPDLTGMEITLHYSDNSSDVLDSDEIKELQGFGSADAVVAAVDEHTSSLFVQYKGFETYTPVTIDANNPVTEISISKNPTGTGMQGLELTTNQNKVAKIADDAEARFEINLMGYGIAVYVAEYDNANYLVFVVTVTEEESGETTTTVSFMGASAEYTGEGIPGGGVSSDVNSDVSSDVSSEATSEVTSDAGSAGEGGNNGVESVMVFAVLGMAAALFVITFRKVRA